MTDQSEDVSSRRRRMHFTLTAPRRANPPYGMSRLGWSFQLFKQGWASLFDGLVLILSLGQVSTAFALRSAFKNARKATRRARAASISGSTPREGVSDA